MTPPEPIRPGWAGLLSGRNAVYAAVLSAGVTLHAVNLYSTITLMPSAVTEIGGMAYYAWNTTVFVMTSIIGAAVSGRMINGLGARLAYVLAALIFAMGSVICAMSPSMPVMLAGRAVQGLGGGMLYALSFAVTYAVLPDQLWSRTIALISGVWGLATLGGPAVGGAFAQGGDWRLAFWVLVGLAVAFAGAAALAIPSAHGQGGKSRLPWLQLVLLCVVILALSAASVTHPLACLMGGFAAMVALVIIDLRSAARLLPTGGYAISTPMGAAFAFIGAMVLSMQPEVFVPYFLQHIHGVTPLIAGYLAALMAAGWTMGSLVSGGIGEDRALRMLWLGPWLGLAGLVLLAVAMPVGTATAMAAICAGLFLVGAGIGIAWPHVVTQVFRAARPEEADLATSGMTTVQLFMTAAGAALAGIVVNLVAGVGADADPSVAAPVLFASFGIAPIAAILIGRRFG